MPIQTATEQGEAELCILNFKTTKSEFQMPILTTAEQGKAKLHILNLKAHGQSSRSPVRLMSGEAKPIYVCTILKKHHLPRVGPKQLCALAHLGCTRAAGTSQ